MKAAEVQIYASGVCREIFQFADKLTAPAEKLPGCVL